MSENTDRLAQLIKQDENTQVMVQDAVQEVAQEQAEKRKNQVKDLVRKAVEIEQNMQNIEKEFNGKLKKYDKELGKLVGRINNMSRGNNSEPNSEEENNGN